MKPCVSVPVILIIPRSVSNIKTTWEMKNIFSSINEKKKKLRFKNPPLQIVPSQEHFQDLYTDALVKCI